MRLFACQSCSQMVYFENVSCTRCEAVLGFAPDALLINALTAGDDGIWQPIGGGRRYRHCANRLQYDVSNWLVPADDPEPYCIACRLDRTIPDLGVEGNSVLWRRLETEKRRLVYSLLRLGLPVVPKHQDSAGIAFDFLADTAPSFNETGRVLTGHAAGLITLNIAEADPVVREQMRSEMAEPYRTILGHFRHESGHYYWDRLVRDSSWLPEVRRLFGDDTEDYAAALDQHYRNGPRPDWAEHHVSAYAATHAWEDWAETWAHYLHIVDTTETAAEFGLSVRPKVGTSAALYVEAGIDPYSEPDFPVVLAHWLPLTYALNSLNRSMGHDLVYPFVLAAPVIEKLDLVHRIVGAARAQSLDSRALLDRPRGTP
jgi:hypothetical protein